MGLLRHPLPALLAAGPRLRLGIPRHVDAAAPTGSATVVGGTPGPFAPQPVALGGPHGLLANGPASGAVDRQRRLVGSGRGRGQRRGIARALPAGDRIAGRARRPAPPRPRGVADAAARLIRAATWSGGPRLTPVARMPGCWPAARAAC